MNIGSRSPARPASGGSALAPLLVVALALALAGCAGSSPARTGAAPPATGAARPAMAVAPGSGTQGATVKIPKYVAADNVRKYVSATSCAQAGRRGWRLRGTATNASSSSRAYSIVVDFVTVKGNTVLDTKLLTVGPIAPKSAVGWSVTGAAGQHQVACVIRQALTR
jgi:hypothetical protein